LYTPDLIFSARLLSADGTAIESFWEFDGHSASYGVESFYASFIIVT
jgi:hypothetical protein